MSLQKNDFFTRGIRKTRFHFIKVKKSRHGE